MGDPQVREACGIVGISAERPIFGELCVGLRALQHRGQESAGLAVHTPEGLQLRVAMGLVADVFREKPPEFGKPLVGIGHVRYSTAGDSNELNAQPIRIDSSVGALAVAHNGTIANQEQLRQERLKAGWAFVSETDSEVIVRMVANQLSQDHHLILALKNTLPQLMGSYALAFMVNERLFAIRDPLGIKPLCLGRLEERHGYALASESAALDAIQAKVPRDGEPGGGEGRRPSSPWDRRRARCGPGPSAQWHSGVTHFRRPVETLPRAGSPWRVSRRSRARRSA